MFWILLLSTLTIGLAYVTIAPIAWLVRAAALFESTYEEEREGFDRAAIRPAHV